MSIGAIDNYPVRFTTRVGAYVALMDDRYPSTDEEQSVHLTMHYPDPTTDLTFRLGP